MPDHSIPKRVLACCLLLFPILFVLGFILHFSSIHVFLDFKLERPAYDAGRLFNALAAGKGHGYFLAHTIVYLAVAFFLVAMLVLSWYLFRVSPLLAFPSAVIGVLGCLAMAGVMSTWLSFTAIGRVQPEYYDGARAALVELTKKEGFLKWNTGGSYLAFIGLILLAIGLWIKRQFAAGYMVCIVLGSLLFVLFMDMDNWMLIGTVLISIGLLPVVKRLWGKG